MDSLKFSSWNFRVKNSLVGGGGDGFFTYVFFCKGGDVCVNNGSGKVTASSGNAGVGSRDISLTLGIFGNGWGGSRDKSLTLGIFGNGWGGSRIKKRKRKRGRLNMILHKKA